MDAQRFDALARTLHIAGTRRTLSGLLAVLLALLAMPWREPEEAAAKGRRKRIHRRHKHRQGRRKNRRKKRKNKRKKRCKAKSRARICANRCGIIKNKKTCKKRVDCGPCVACSETQPCSDGQVCWQGACVCGDVCAEGCQYSTIQDAIDDPTGPTTLQLCAGTYQEGVIVTRSLTLRGAGQEENGGTVLDGQDQHRVVLVSEGVADVVLAGLRITGGLADLGGGLLNPDSKLTLTACTVADNVADAGGGILNRAGTVVLTDSSVTGNQATGTGGDGGGIYTGHPDFGGKLTLINSTVSGNTAGSGGVGGGIFSNGGTVNLDADSHVCGNTPDQCSGFINPVACTATCPG